MSSSKVAVSIVLISERLQGEGRKLGGKYFSCLVRQYPSIHTNRIKPGKILVNKSRDVRDLRRKILRCLLKNRF